MGAFSPWHILVLLLVVVLVFGTKKLGNVGSDLGRAIRDFKKSLNSDEAEPDKPTESRIKADDPAATDKTSNEQRDRVD